MTNQVIPAEAVEAAARRIFACAEYGHRSREWDALERRNAINQARAALEAAAPHMLSERAVESALRLAADLDKLADGDRHYAALIRKAVGASL